MSKLDSWKTGLSKTRNTTFGRIATFLGATEIKADTWDELEAMLIQADIGIEITNKVIQDLKELVRQEGWTKAEQIQTGLRNSLIEFISDPPDLKFNNKGPTIILVVGVNGSGKTTSIAKLSKIFSNAGKKVILAAADTFRAAAVEQLKLWGDRLDVRIISGQPEGDPGAVTYDAIQSALARNEDILLIDTAGRLHTRYNLMEELKKVQRVAQKTYPGAPHHVWLVIDATTGQNAIQQAIAFKEAVDVDGVILSKLDSSARGGMVFAIRKTLDLPILYVGLGEGENDLLPFSKEAFLDGILADFR